MRHLKPTYLLLISLFIFGYTKAKKRMDSDETIKLLTVQKQYKVGNEISLLFLVKTNKPTYLYCSNSYGSTILTAKKIKKNKTQFTLPNYISNKTGIVNWILIVDSNEISGNLNIIPKTQPTTLETYIGPPSIEAGGKDYAMMVVIPTDNLDNPIKNNTEVIIQHQFLDSEKKDHIYTNDLIAFKNINSPIKNGRMLLSSNCLGLHSKEYNINVLPSISTNFDISAQRHHTYADGNQLTTFTTSILKDSYGNIVSDGTFVEFYITTSKGTILKTYGTTINGIANAKMIHPDYEDQWLVKAYVIGISESNILKLQFKKVIDTFNTAFSDKNRKIKVGPLKSFMNQMIPDGLEVKLSIYKDGKLLNEYLKESQGGYVNFILDKNIFDNGVYTLSIKTAEVTQTYKDKKLW